MPRLLHRQRFPSLTVSWPTVGSLLSVVRCSFTAAFTASWTPAPKDPEKPELISFIFLRTALNSSLRLKECSWSNSHIRCSHPHLAQPVYSPERLLDTFTLTA